MAGQPIFQWPSLYVLLLSVSRLGLAAVLGTLLGYQRERVHSTAGLRTHILVCLGSAFFVLASVEAGQTSADISRVIQGIVAGIGFLGAGTILKVSDRLQVHGLTTAASIWLTAAIGAGAGLGHLWLPVLGAVIGWIVLGPVGQIEKARPPQNSGS
ncbi:MAG TPA: MgtC/SapB family protein [Thermoanaerobaculia bacterium]|nr:MgtC/SapB family protein [Thermoanaerobaculia bacterium]